MLLGNLIKNISKEKSKIKINGLAVNSENVKKAYIFFAIKGNKLNGENYITKAIQKGAAVVICSNKCNYKSTKVVILKFSNVRHLLSEICSKFYKSKPKNIIAVTGTNGKTSVADFFYQIMKINNLPVASIGTLGIKYKNRIIKTDLTTPDAISIHQALEKIKNNKIDNVIIEASSHSLNQQRIDHLNLKVGIFTNFSQDHLDYHKSMLSYLNSKLLLFKNILPKKKILISDKSLKEFLILKKISKKRRLKLIDISTIEDYLKTNYGSKFNKFQIKNISMAIAAAETCGLTKKKIFRSIKKLRDVNGRIEHVRTFINNVRVFVDFAHTPDALLKVLQELKIYGDISLVFGCGGDRDFKKRSLMAKIADVNCKKIYVTDDNPRSEKPEKIRKEIIRHIKNKNVFNISSRDKAIKAAITGAEPNEIILIAGKGHETQQIYKNRIINKSDKQIIRKIRIIKKKIFKTNLNFLQNKIIFEDLKNKIKIKNFHGLAIDSREVKKNNLFITIKGKNNDGVKFISHALKRGALKIISSRKIKKFRKKMIKVDNEIKFLNNFAMKKRNISNAKIIAITGSAGKTSLKNLLKDLLKNFGNTYCSPKSYNNNFGVPISLSNLRADHKYGIFEVGMSKSGEIDYLSKIIKPHIGIITNIGEAHIENFKNLKGIADAKSEMINNIQPDGTIILNRDDKYYDYIYKKSKLKGLKVVSFGLHKNSNIHLVSKSKNKINGKFKIKVFDKYFYLKLNGVNIYNTLSSIALLKVLNLNLNKITREFKKYQPSDGRGKIHKISRYKKKFKLIDESYNSNPLSMKNAIKNFNAIKKINFKKYLLLGEMLELGDKSEIYHRDLSKVINNSDIDKVFVKGEKAIITYQNIQKEKRGNIFQQDEDMDFTLKNIIANNDYLMIKGSNATGLNSLTKKIIKGH